MGLVDLKKVSCLIFSQILTGFKTVAYSGRDNECNAIIEMFYGSGMDFALRTAHKLKFCAYLSKVETPGKYLKGAY